MTVNTAYFALMYAGLGFMLLQLLVKQKKPEHLFFAIFCGSMAMVAAQQLSAETLGPYQYLFGLGACATCNAMWLISKALFSGKGAVALRHVLFALSIALLIVINNAINMAYEFSAFGVHTYQRLGDGLGEVTKLLSSTVLALTCWEAFKGITKQNHQDFWQRVIFIVSFCFGFILCTVVAKTFFAPEILPQIYPWLMSVSAIQMMAVTQIILWWKQTSSLWTKAEAEINIQATENEAIDLDQSVITGIHRLVDENKGYLTHNLKMIDLANKLNVSEYKISRAIRYHFAAPNFNHYINSLRINHAKCLLAQAETQDWPILVIALESGFSSLATFNRVFKAQLGYAPNQHRKNHASPV